jgi:hypothetical protein
MRELVIEADDTVHFSANEAVPERERETAANSTAEFAYGTGRFLERLASEVARMEKKLFSIFQSVLPSISFQYRCFCIKHGGEAHLTIAKRAEFEVNMWGISSALCQPNPFSLEHALL